VTLQELVCDAESEEKILTLVSMPSKCFCCVDQRSLARAEQSVVDRVCASRLALPLSLWGALKTMTLQKKRRRPKKGRRRFFQLSFEVPNELGALSAGADARSRTLRDQVVTIEHQLGKLA